LLVYVLYIPLSNHKSLVNCIHFNIECNWVLCIVLLPTIPSIFAVILDQQLSNGVPQHTVSWACVTHTSVKNYEQTRQALYVQRNNEARSCNHCWGGKAIDITYSKCMSVALGIQHVMSMRHIVVCGLSGSTIFFQVISQRARSSGEKKLLKVKRVLIFLQLFLKHFSFYELSELW